jgi:hypothetical protein
MRATVLALCAACLLFAATPYTVAAPIHADDPALQNIDALGDSEPDRWQGRHHYLYDENHQPDDATVGSAPSEARGCANEPVRLKRLDGSTFVRHFKRCD